MQSRLISYEKALQLAIEAANPLGIECLDFKNALNCVLAKSIVAPFDLPRFDNSAVDGFGIHFEDLEHLKSHHEIKLELVKTIAAGDVDRFDLKPGQTVHIMTGAQLPNNVAAIIMQEDVIIKNDDTVFLTKQLLFGENIRFCGEELKTGDEMIAEKAIVSPAVIAAAASIGQTKLNVYQKPRIGLLITGNELILSGELKDGQVYESNSHGLIAALQNIGLKPTDICYVKDDLVSIEKSLVDLWTKCDVVISIGGVSVGKYDFVRPALQNIRVEEIFSGVAIKPGKPVSLFKFKKSKFIFALPGNPMSSLIIFYALVVPFLKSMMGFEVKIKYKKAILTTDLRKKPGRVGFIPAKIIDSDKLLVKPLSKQGSHMLSGLAVADHLIVFPSELDVLSVGDQVDTLSLKDFQ